MNLLALLPDFEDDFHHVVDVALGVDAAGNRQAHEVHLGRGSEHQGADLDRADAAFEIEFIGEGNGGKVIGRNVRQKGSRVNVDGVAARRLYDRHALLGNVVAQVAGRSDAVFEVVMVQRFLESDGDGFEIASGQASVGGIALGENQQVLLLLRQRSSLVQRNPPMFAMPSFFADMVQPSP